VTSVGGPATLIPCMNVTCAPSARYCCITESQRGRTERCLSATEDCAAGDAVTCIDHSACTAGHVCCKSHFGPLLSCVTPDACEQTPSAIACRRDGDCPAPSAHCCRTHDIGICAVEACPP
jgi:hypothetical protein